MLFRPRDAAWNTTCRPGESPVFLFFTGFPVSRSGTSLTPIDSGKFRSGKDLLYEEENVERRRREALSTKGKISDWAMRHQYPLILGSWAASLGVAAAIIMKDRHQTPSQKVCEVLYPLESSDWLVGPCRLFKRVCGHRG